MRITKRIGIIQGGPLQAPARVGFLLKHGIWFCDRVDQDLSKRLPGNVLDGPLGRTPVYFEALAKHWKAEWIFDHDTADQLAAERKGL